MKIAKLVLPAVSVLSLSLIAVQASALETLTWQQSIKDASELNSQLRAARATLDSARYAERAAYSGFMPEANAVVGANVARANQDTNGFFTSGEKAATNYSAGLSMTQNLFAGFETSSKVEQAQANVRAAEAGYVLAKAQVSNILVVAFQNAKYAQDFRKLTQDIVKRRGDNLRLVQLRFESGRENKGSVSLSRAYLAEAKWNDLQARNQKLIAVAQLEQALGRELNDDVEISGEIPTQDVTEPAPDFKSLIGNAPSHLQTVAQEEAALAGIRLSRSKFMPDLDLKADIGLAGPQVFPENRSWSVGLNLTIPLFKGGENYYGYKNATAQWVVASASRLNADRALQATLAQSFATYLEAVEKLKVDGAFREAALLRAEIARNKYNNGLMTFDDWDVIENDLIGRQKGYLTSDRDRVTSESNWEMAQGKGVFK